jgi:hypothetical protein
VEGTRCDQRDHSREGDGAGDHPAVDPADQGKPGVTSCGSVSRHTVPIIGAAWKIGLKDQ